jgi:endonuclease/exonuclease/phosphatase family metal-dependent hydrolase
MPELRVMTYNIFMGGRRGTPLHELVREVSPDVLLVNESPKLPLVWKRQCKKLADKWRMRFIGGGRKAGSNMVTVAPGIAVKAMSTQIIQQPFLKPRRGLVAAQLRIDGLLFGVVACHLNLSPERRGEETERVIRAADRLRGPVIVAGDLNERPGGPSWAKLRQAGFIDHGSQEWLTFPADDPKARIDALLVRGNARVLHHGHPGVPIDLQVEASDHRPVLAVLDI